MQKSQIDQISDLLLSYSAGDYKVRGEVSDELNDIDMIISGINMLGEELRVSNVSKEYFSSIFNAVTDLVMIADEDGKLIDVNQSTVYLTGYPEVRLMKTHINDILTESCQDFFETVKRHLTENSNRFIREAEILTTENSIVYGLFTCSRIFNRFGKFKGYLISVKDITAEKEKEKLILKTILSTQSAEQRRVADDLHDSLGQELSMAQLMISNFDRYEVADREFYNLVELCRDIMEGAINRLREICFDLMPNVLVRGGIVLAVNTLVAKLEYLEEVEVEFTYPDSFSRLFPDLEIVIYRIIQEFINNMIKHSEANKLSIKLIDSETMVKVSLIEDGQGFDINKLNNIGENRGISNIRTKVKAFNGHYDFNSVIGKGTWLTLEFPKKETT